LTAILTGPPGRLCSPMLKSNLSPNLQHTSYQTQVTQARVPHTTVQISQLFCLKPDKSS